MIFWILLSLGNAIIPDNYCNPRFPEFSHPNVKFVKHLTIISRHGDRSPDARCWPNGPTWDCSGLIRRETSFEPSNPNIGNVYSHLYEDSMNVNPGNCGKGALTSTGYDQHNLNGVLLQTLYPSLFLNSSGFYVRATDVPRVYQSAQGLLDSLPSQEAAIPIFTRDTLTESMTTNKDRCPILEEIEGAYLKSAAFQKHFKEVTIPLMKEASAVFSMPEDLDLEDLFDCVQSTACHNFSFPQGFSQDLYNRIIADVSTTESSGLAWVDQVSGKTGAAIAMGSFLGEVMARINAAANGQSQEKFAFFSGQSSTVLPLLVALGAWKDDGKGKTVPYAALLRIEYLEMESGDKLINVLYEDNPISIDGCNTMPCSLAKFQQAAQQVIEAAQQCYR